MGEATGPGGRALRRPLSWWGPLRGTPVPGHRRMGFGALLILASVRVSLSTENPLTSWLRDSSIPGEQQGWPLS